MRFRVTFNINDPVTGHVFYTIPTTEELQKAERNVIDICNERLAEVYKANTKEEQRIIETCLINEIERMRVTETSYHFIVVKEIAELSQEEGYPIMPLGNLSGSIISYLLGITKYDPFSAGAEHYVPEFIWGTDTNITIPNFTIGIAPQIRSLISERLDSKYSSVECDNDIFKQISLVDVKTCEMLGSLSKATGKRPFISDIDNTVYNQVVRNIIDESMEEDSVKVLLYEEIKQITNWDFHSVLRLYAYTLDSFNHTKSILNLNNKDFFVTRDEFFNNLTRHNVPTDIALDIVKKGVRSTGAKREKYVKELEKYNVPEYIKNYFSDVTHLWVSTDCVGRLLHMCYMAWYQEHFPTEFEQLS